MTTNRSQLFTAGALLLATAATGVAVNGVSRAHAPIPPEHQMTFTAPSTGPVQFTGALDRTAVLIGRDGVARMELVMSAAAGESRQSVRRPTDVVIIFDRSGSMSGDKLVHARAAVDALLAQLGAQDRFALVTYSDEARLAIPLAAVDEGKRVGWRATVAQIQAEGGTNMASGLDLGLDLVERGRADGHVPHVVLISDGLANQGDATPEGLMRRARRASQGEFMLSSVGVGTDFNEYLMTALADAGTGNYYYVQDPRELSGVFAREFDAARTTVASGLSVQIQPGPGVRVVDAAGYPMEATGDGVVIRPGSLFAGQERRIWVSLAVPQNMPGEYELGHFSLAYGEPHNRTVLAFSDVPRVASVRDANQFYANVDVSNWGRSVAVDSYNKMQQDVAREVQAGRRDEAIKRLHDFKAEIGEMNARLRSAPVEERLYAVDQLEDAVAGAFEGPDQAKRQNELSKSTSAQAVDGRRAGAKK